MIESRRTKISPASGTHVRASRAGAAALDGGAG